MILLGSPVKASSLKLKIKPAKSEETRPTTSQMDDDSYREYFGGVVRNSTCASSMPLTTIYQPVNIFAMAKDHEYGVLSMEDIFLLSNRLQAIKPEEREV